MKVDWVQRWLIIPYKGTYIKLHGISPEDQDHTADLLVQLSTFLPDQHSTPLPPEISALLSGFPSVTCAPSSLPPQRDCDHEIPLVEGARPVSVRPYRYPPALKDEIEAQVDAMLKQGLIQPSTYPFNSPVLMVRKKDGSWRFCVDYRYLNALTVKTAFPIPCLSSLWMSWLALGISPLWTFFLDIIRFACVRVRSIKLHSPRIRAIMSSRLWPLAYLVHQARFRGP